MNIDNVRHKSFQILREQEKHILKFYKLQVKKLKKQFDEDECQNSDKENTIIKKEIDLGNELDFIK